MDLTPPTDLSQPYAWSKWILECGCDPMAEHCLQCDARRRIRSEHERKQQIEFMRAEVAEYDRNQRKES